MDVAIAGGHGQVARRLARLLANRGDRVRGLIRNPEHADDLRALVASQPGITLREIKAALAARGIVVKALSTIADMLHRLGLSHKKEPESGRAGPAGRGAGAATLACLAALCGPEPLRLSG